MICLITYSNNFNFDFTTHFKLCSRASNFRLDILFDYFFFLSVLIFFNRFAYNKYNRFIQIPIFSSFISVSCANKKRYKGLNWWSSHLLLLLCKRWGAINYQFPIFIQWMSFLILQKKCHRLKGKKDTWFILQKRYFTVTIMTSIITKNSGV